MSKVEVVHLWGCPLTLGNAEQLLEHIHTKICNRERSLVLSANAHAYNIAAANPVMKRALQRADWVRLDGVGPQLAAWVLGYRLCPRIPLADFIWRLAAEAEQHRYRVFLLGGVDGMAQQAAYALQRAYPGLQITGTHHGYFDHTPTSPANQRVLRMIHNAQPDILLVGFGMPVQEAWLLQVEHELPHCVIMTGGGVFSYIARTLPRAHPILRRFGFEWLGRLFIEPRRLWRRYLIGNPKFVYRVLRQRFRA